MVLVPFCVLFVLILSLCLVVSLLWTSAFPPCVLTYLQGLSASIVHLVSSVSHVSMFVYLSINVKFIYLIPGLCVLLTSSFDNSLFCCIPQVCQVPPPLILGLLSSVSPASWVHSLPATHPQSTTEDFCLGVCFSTSKHPLGVFVFFVLFCPTKHLENCL